MTHDEAVGLTVVFVALALATLACMLWACCSLPDRDEGDIGRPPTRSKLAYLTAADIEQRYEEESDADRAMRLYGSIISH